MPDYDKPPVLKKVSVFFTALVLVLILVIIYFLSGRAEITIEPSVKAVTANFNLELADQIPPLDEKMFIRGTLFDKKITLEETFTVERADKTVPGKSTGQILIVNNNTREQALVASTRFLSPDNVLLRLTEKVVVPAKSSLKANLLADQPGRQGDIAKDVKLTIPGLNPNLQQLIHGQAQEDFLGGERKYGVLTDQDIISARQNILSKIEEQARHEYLLLYLQATTDTLPVLTPELLTETQIIEEKSSHKIGEAVTAYKLAVAARITGVTYAKNELEITAQNYLISSLPAGEKFVGLESGSLQVSLAGFDLDQGTASLKVSVAGQTLLESGESLANKKKLSGLSAAEVKAYFAALPGVENVEVRLSPFWVKRLPRLAKNIEIEIKKDIRDF